MSEFTSTVSGAQPIYGGLSSTASMTLDAADDLIVADNGSTPSLYLYSRPYNTKGQFTQAISVPQARSILALGFAR